MYGENHNKWMNDFIDKRIEQKADFSYDKIKSEEVDFKGIKGKWLTLRGKRIFIQRDGKPLSYDKKEEVNFEIDDRVKSIKVMYVPKGMFGTVVEVKRDKNNKIKKLDILWDDSEKILETSPDNVEKII